MQKKQILIGYKLLFAFLALSSVAIEIATTLSRSTFNAANFFSYFTIESNLIAAIALLLGAQATTQNHKSRQLDMLRGAATLYMVTTGIVFTVLLSGLGNVEFTAVPWDNLILHYIAPVAVLVDWLIDRAGHIAYKQALLWLIFPVTYLAYSVIRGSVVGWYPYPFLNPATGGYEGIVITSIGIAIFAALLTGILLRFTTNRTSKRSSR